MESHFIRQLFGACPKAHWRALLFLSDSAFNCPGINPWRRVVTQESHALATIIDDLTDKELELWLRDRALRFDEIIVIFSHGRHDVFEITIEDTTRIPDVFRFAAKYGFLKMLQKIAEKYKLNDGVIHTYQLDTLKIAAENGYLEIVEWIVDYFGITSISHRFANIRHILHYTVEKGHLDVMKWLVDMFNIAPHVLRTVVDNSTNTIIQNGHLDMLQWLLSEQMKSTHYHRNPKWIITAAKYGHFEILKWLIGLHGANTGTLIMAAAESVTSGKLEILVWLVNQYKLDKDAMISSQYRVFYNAISLGKLKILQWVVKRFAIDRDEFIELRYFPLHMAIIEDRLEIVQWADETFNLGKKYITFNHIVSRLGSHSEGKILKWVIEKYDLKKREVIDKDDTLLRQIAQYGHLELFKWITEKFKLTQEDIITNNNEILELMVRSGNLELLQWIIKQFKLNKDEVIYGCPFIAKKIGQRYLKVLIWLVQEYDI